MASQHRAVAEDIVREMDIDWYRSGAQLEMELAAERMVKAGMPRSDIEYVMWKIVGVMKNEYGD